MKNIFSKWMPKPWYRVSFYMKSGQVIKVDCREIQIKSSGEELTSYKMTGLKHPGQAMFIRITDISAITYVKL
jgi:hypothetical protein